MLISTKIYLVSHEENKEEVKLEEPINEAPILGEGLSDDQMIKNFLAKIGIERQYILFGDAPMNGAALPSELITKQRYIRNKLNMNDGANIEFSLDKAFKIIDALNMQTLFVYDPDFENYWIDDGYKRSTSESGPRIFSYFTSDDREWAIWAEDYKRNDILMKLCACGHVFHADWWENYIYYSSHCSFCRQDIYQE